MEKIEDAVKIGERGQIVIPKEIREKHHLQKGDILIIRDIGGSISIKELRPEITSWDVFREIGKALRESGYDTPGKVKKLVDEVKKEVADKWLKE